MAQSETLRGKFALVSGSARGIGAAICVELASRGALVAVNYPWPEQHSDAKDVIRRIKETNGLAASNAFAIEADLSTLDGPSELVEAALRISGREKIDILINNAGRSAMKPLQQLTVQDWEAVVNLNGRGTFLLTQAVLPHLAQNSRIVSTSSVGARQGYVGATIYNGTKAMIESFTRCWALELGRSHGCTVNAICPGPTNTYNFNHAGPEFMAKIQPMLEATPMGGRMAESEEIAFAAAFLCEPGAGWVTGVCLGVNGGFTMS